MEGGGERRRGKKERKKSQIVWDMVMSLLVSACQ